MNVLVACEESQRVCTAFRERGHTAWSCDIQQCSGGHPEWHILGDCLPILNGNCEFTTEAGGRHLQNGRWDLIIAHPPCTYLSGVTTRHLSLRMNPPEKVISRMWMLAEGAVFFTRLAEAPAERVCVENPQGFMSRLYRKPDQVIEPYYFAESEADEDNYEHKRTCLWLRGLPLLVRTTNLPSPPAKGFTKSGKAKHFEETATGNRAKTRSKTFPGIARAMAEQWG